MKRTDTKTFAALVAEHFSFLLQQGFGVIRTEIVDDFVKVDYASAKVFLTIKLQMPDYDVRIEFGRIGIDDKPPNFAFEIGDIIQTKGCSGWQWQSGPDTAETYLKEYARLFKACGDSMLSGDEAIFAEMHNRRVEQVDAWKKKEMEAAIREQAQSQWQARDYRAVVESYGKLENLNEVENKRLRFALKQSAPRLRKLGS